MGMGIVDWIVSNKVFKSDTLSQHCFDKFSLFQLLAHYMAQEVLSRFKYPLGFGCCFIAFWMMSSSSTKSSATLKDGSIGTKQYLIEITFLSHASLNWSLYELHFY